jgi:acyl-coenzyme A synthetase/AMP-(fatty) acid ligase
VLGSLSLSFWIGRMYEHFLRHCYNSYCTVSLALRLLHKKHITPQKGEDDEWVGGCRGASSPWSPDIWRNAYHETGFEIHPF